MMKTFMGKPIDTLYLTKAEFAALPVETQKELASELPSNCVAFYSEANRKAQIPETPCVIDGVLILE